MEFKISTKIISLMLSMLMVFMAFPAEVFALGEEPTTVVENTVEATYPQTEKVDVTVVSEDVSRRTATSKEFLLSDGSRMVAAYDYDVHYEEDGEWLEIDNRLIYDEESGTYATENGGVSFMFSNNAGEENMVRIENGEYTLAFGVSNIKGNANARVKKEIKKSEKSNTSRNEGYYDAGKLASEAGHIEHAENTVTYEDGIDGIDFQYVLMGNTLRENIILNEKFNKYEYEFFVKADGMTAVLEEDGSITFSAQGDEIFTIPAPFMYDASGEKSTDVSYKLKEKKDGYYLTLTASKDWINAEERQFPVIIDPDIEVDVDNSSVVKVTTLNNTKNSTSLFVGRTGTSEYQAYVKLSTLPVIPAGSLITDANVTMCQMYSGQGYSGDTTATIKIAVEKVTSSWSSSTSSFANVTTDGRVLDYTTTYFSSSPRNLTFDITSAVIDWYNCSSYMSSTVPANYGLKFYRADDGTHDGLAKFFPVTASLVTEPFIKITYRDVRGISGLYSYQTLDIGGHDTAYVNDFAGNLVYEHTDYTSIADVMDFSIGHVYNSVTAYYGYNYVNTTCANGLYSMQIHTPKYSNMYVGRGWKLNLYESLYLDSSTGYLIYNDASGMEYYFKPTDNGFEDEDGLGITVTGTGGSYTMTCEDGYSATKTFYNGMLYRITDEDENYIQLVYNTTDTKPADYSRLTSVKQYIKETNTTVTIATFAYNSSNYLSTITDRYGNVTTYTYDNGYLTNISSTDGKSVNYLYDTSSTAMLTNIHNAELIYGLDIEYENRKVSCFTEFNGIPGLDQEYGNRIRVERNGKNRTVTYAYDSKNDSGVYENKTYTTYVFDYNGQTVTTYSTDGGDYDTNNSGNLKLFGAAAYRYNESTSGRTNRLLKNYAVTGAESHNLLTNGNAESSLSGWSVNTSSESDVFGASSTVYRNGSYSFSLTNNSCSTGGIYRTLTLNPGTTYTVSGYVKTDSAYRPFSAGAGVYFDVDGIQSEHITNSYGQWERISVTFTTSNSSSSTVYRTLSVITSNAYGTAYVDDIMVEEAEAPGTYNLLENSTFDVTSTVKNGTNAAVVSGGLNGSKALRLTSSISSDAKATLESGFVNYPAGQSFVLSGWAKAESVALREDSDATLGLEVYIVYLDETEETQYVSFNSETTAWQYVNYTVIPEQAKGIMYLGVRCKYGYNNGIALFDNISLVKSVVQRYNYDENGNVSEYSDGTRTYTYTYDANGKLESIVDDKGDSVAIDNENDTVTDNKNGVKSDTDTDGNTEVNVTSSVSTPSLKQTSTIIYADASRTKVSSATDVNGITTTYTYNSDDLVLTEKIGDTTVNYRYNDDGTVSMSYISGVASVNYVYDNGQLTEVSRGGYISGNSTKQTQKYNYTYDDFGNLLSLTVGTDAGERALVAYSYSGVNGEVSRMTYGNGQYVDYTYDEFERVSQVSVNGTAAYTYTYDNNGNVARADDLLLDTTYLYYYDDNGALIKTICTDDDRTFKVLTENNSSNSRVESTIFEIDSSAQKYSFLYCDEDTTYTKNNEDLLRKVTLPNNSYLLYGYDNLNRRPYAKTYTSSGTLIFENHTQFKANGNSTTNLVSYYQTGNETDGYRVFTYTYDAYGNIVYIDNPSNLYIPFRYRGYYYDSDTGFYYLQSRYYDPETGRFLNADDVDFLGLDSSNLSYNLFAYCGNNPIAFSDYSGYLRIKTWVVSTALDVAFAVLNQAMEAGYLAYSATIWVLSRSVFTRNAAKKLIKNTVIPVFVRGFYNPVLTCARKVLQTFGSIGKAFAKGWRSDTISTKLSKYVDTRFYDFVSSIMTWGGIIGLMLDSMDGSWDGYITI